MKQQHIKSPIVEWPNRLMLIFVACQYVLPNCNVQLLSPNQNTKDNKGYIPYHPRQVARNDSNF
jgi:hypothetical protein